MKTGLRAGFFYVRAGCATPHRNFGRLSGADKNDNAGRGDGTVIGPDSPGRDRIRPEPWNGQKPPVAIPGAGDKTAAIAGKSRGIQP